MFYVYEFYDENDKVFYVGKGSGSRFYSHEAKARRGVVSHFYNKLRKIWASGMTHRKRKVFETENEALAFDEEKRRIAWHGRENLTNQTDGGDGPCNPSDEVREKIAKSRRGRKVSEETRKKQSEAAKNRQPISKETGAKISAALKGRKAPWASERARENLKKMKMSAVGRTWTENQRKLFLAKRIGHIVTQETRDKISQTKKRNNENRKRQLCNV